MDSHISYPEIVKRILQIHATFYSQGSRWPLRTVFDDTQHSYLLMDIGWRDYEYIHNAMIHIDIIEQKIWIQNDDTEQGVAGDLLEAGVGKDDIVLGFRPPDLRQYTGFASVDTPVASRDLA